MDALDRVFEMEDLKKSIRVVALLGAIVLASTRFGSWSVAADQVDETRDKKLPRMAIENVVHDFGDIVPGEKAVATFLIRNAGDGVLHIEEAVADSRRVTVVLPERSIAPGEEGVIQAILDTTGLYGDFAGRIRVSTNDTTNGEAMLTATANVRPLLALNPPQVWAGQVAQDASFSGQAKVVGKLVEEGELPNLTIKKSAPGIEATITQRFVKGKTVPFLKFSLLPELKAGTFRETITVVSEDPPAQAQVLVVGQKLGDIQFTPYNLEFFQSDGEVPDSQSVLFESEKTFHITKVEDLSDLFDISVDTVEEGKKYKLNATFKEPPPASFLGVLKVHTDLEEHPLIHIPVIGGTLVQQMK